MDEKKETTVSWERESRRRHPWTVLYMLGMRIRRDSEAFSGVEHTRRQALELQDHGDVPPTWWTRRRLSGWAEQRDGMTVWRLRPRRRRPRLRVLYLHGGGYVHPLTADYWRLVRALSRVPAEVIVPFYPLAPEAHADDILPRLLDLYRSESGLPVVVMGDSAGGALAVEIAMLARDRGLRPPRRVVCLCPWLDATLADPAVAQVESNDPMLAESGLRAAGRWWAGPRDLADPLVSPVRGRLEGLPGIDVLIGDRDILRPAVDDFFARARAAGAAVDVHEVCAMFHVWMTRAVPEGRRTRRWLVRRLRSIATR